MFVDGYEIDVGDPVFYQSVEDTNKLVNQLSEYAHDNMP